MDAVHRTRHTTPAHLRTCARAGDVDSMAAMLDRSRRCAFDVRLLESCLLTCAFRGHEACLQLLLNRGAKPDGAKGDRGATALLLAAQGGHAGCLRRLLDADADIEHTGTLGRTALIVASRQGRTDCAKLLCERGAATDPVAPHVPLAERTAMAAACSRGHLPVVVLLSLHGAPRPSETEWSGYSPAVASWLARSRGWSTPLHHLQLLTPERTRALLRAGADVSAGSPSPLQLAEAMVQEEASAGASADGESSAELVRRAAEPWSAANHELFPDDPRARAVELLHTGHLLARSTDKLGPAFVDAWSFHVMPQAVLRTVELVQ